MNNASPNDFYDRVDALVQLANQQCDAEDKGKVSASFLFAASRFNTWVSASGFESAQLMKANREQLIEHFVNQYQAMLEDNIDEFIENFERYLSKNNARDHKDERSDAL